MDASELLGGVQTSFRTNCLKNKKIANAAKKIQSGKGTYKDVDTYAAETGKALSRALRSNLSADKLPNRHMDAETARTILQPTLEENYNLVADAAEQVQQSLNQGAGNGLKPIRPKLKQDKINGMISRIDEEEDFDDIAWMLDDPVTNFTQSVADDAVQDNFEFQSEAGMTPKIVRTAESGACKWCQELEGEYDYADVKSGHSDVYRRHENCGCIVEFVPGDGSRQNVHSKEWSRAAKYDPAELEAKASAYLDSTIWSEVVGKKTRIQNGFSAFPEGSFLENASKRIKPDGKSFDVACHGTVDGIGFGTEKPNMKARDLARVILRDPEYNGQSIRLLACDTGKTPDDGDYCFAEELANALGVTVYAPDTILYIDENGDFYIGFPGRKDFTPFEPNQRGRYK